MELAGSGVDVTVVYPGFLFSEINRRALSPYGDRGYGGRTGETIETGECCRLIPGAVARCDRDLVMTWRGKVGRIVKLLSPSLVDRLARRTMRQRP